MLKKETSEYRVFESFPFAVELKEFFKETEKIRKFTVSE